MGRVLEIRRVDMSYEFREVICPYCQHRYMTHKVSEWCDYRDKITGKKMYVEKCPKCSNFLFAIENVLEGIKEDDERVTEADLM